MLAIPVAVTWASGQLILLDQTRLPHEEAHLVCETIEAVFAAIRELKVRGAPAIGIAAAYGLLIGLGSENNNIPSTNEIAGDRLLAQIKSRVEYLSSARPTAVNLTWALRRMLACALRSKDMAQHQLLQRLEQEAVAIHAEDRAACQAIGAAGANLVVRHPNVLTHCNAGALAVSELGTALAPIYVAATQGAPVHVYVDETRPLLQGARLTAYELGKAGIRRTLITDNMAAHVMSSGQVDMVLVGADRVAANGDVANKIGTLNLAILCAYYQIPFYVACPASTIDLQTQSGGQIHIEQRHGDEVRGVGGQRVAEVDTPVYNPAFDITPAKLVTGIITDRGILGPPYKQSLASKFQHGT